jgi:Ca2+-transporting ATPase
MTASVGEFQPRGPALVTDQTRGLTSAEATECLRSCGPNELTRTQGPSLLTLLVRVAGEPMILLLIACSVVYILLGDPHESLVLAASIVVVIGISLYQTQRTERAVAALRELSSPRARVIRDGSEQRIPSREIVPRDIFVVAEGDRIPADGIVVRTVHLEIDESLLTGESAPVAKVPEDLESTPSRAAGEVTSLVYAGTLVVAGQGLVQVTTTGIQTELGRIGVSLATVEHAETPLQRQMAAAVRVAGALGTGLCVLVALLYGITRASWLEGALAGLALAMSLMPEEFPVVQTLFLALGAWRIARRNVLVRHTAALEALGATTVLCVDKTGTLTENRMRLAVLSVDRARWAPPPSGTTPPPEPFHRLLEFAVLASDENPFDPMDRAIGAFATAALAGTEHLHRKWRLAREYPLSRDLLAMTHVWRAAEREHWVVAAKGAPEAVADLCHLSAADTRLLVDEVSALAADGLRVLAVAAAVAPPPTLPTHQHDFPFELVGLLGFEDPLRPAVPGSIALCRRAGIRTVMITGDYPATARAAAERIGLGPARVLTGAELAATDDAGIAARVSDITVFARVVPEQKLRIVRAFTTAGQVVAMTGDGVNDAPALRAANIGIAMGKRGTDVAREAADLVLADDDFTSIVGAIRLGRRIYDNIRKALRYVISVHVPIAGISLLPVLLRWPLVLLPLHIVFLELIIDPACSIAFESEPEEPDVMDRPPRGADEPVLDLPSVLIALAHGGLALLIVGGLLVAATLAGYPPEHARTLAFAALVLANLGLILTGRQSARYTRAVLRPTNRPLAIVVAGALTVLAAVLEIPPLRTLFQLAPLTALDAVLVGLSALAALGCFEAVNAFGKRRERAPCGA